MSDSDSRKNDPRWQHRRAFAEFICKCATAHGFKGSNGTARAVYGPNFSENDRRKASHYRNGARLFEGTASDRYANALGIDPVEREEWNRLFRLAEQERDQEKRSAAQETRAARIAAESASHGDDEPPAAARSVDKHQQPVRAGGGLLVVQETPKLPDDFVAHTPLAGAVGLEPRTEARRWNLKHWGIVAALGSAIIGIAMLFGWEQLSARLPFLSPPSAERALAALDPQRLVVYGDTNAPVRLYAVLDFDNCYYCLAFIRNDLGELERDLVTKTGKASIIIVPWWSGGWQQSAGFEVAYGATCVPSDKRGGFYMAIMSRGPQVAQTVNQAYNLVRGTAKDPRGLVACLDNLERRKAFKEDGEALVRSIKGRAARIYINGTSFSVNELDNIRAEVRRLIDKL